MLFAVLFSAFLVIPIILLSLPLTATENRVDIFIQLSIITTKSHWQAVIAGAEPITAYVKLGLFSPR